MSKAAKKSSTPVSAQADASPNPETINYLHVFDTIPSLSNNTPPNSTTWQIAPEVANPGLGTGELHSTVTVSGNGTYTVPLPYVGDHIPNDLNDLNKKWVGPGLPWNEPWTMPGTVPGFTPSPAAPPRTTGFMQQMPTYWGVQQNSHLNGSKGGDAFWVVNPQSLPLIQSSGARIVARCETENDALFLAKLLNEDFLGKQEPEQIMATDDDGDYNGGSSSIKIDVRDLNHFHVKSIVKNLEGKTLTVIDAAITHESQSKAVKSILKKNFRDVLSQVYAFAHRLDGNSDGECDQADEY